MLYYGRGRNGKGVLLHALMDLLGQYCGVLSCDVLTRPMERSMIYRTRLQGKRLATVHMLMGTKRLNTKSMLELTEGRPVVARRLYKKLFDFEPLRITSGPTEDKSGGLNRRGG